MLDDLKYIHSKDPQDALGLAEKQWQQLEHAFEAPDIDKPKRIVYAGMGGSAFAGLIAISWPGFRQPFELVRDYSLPAYVDNETLVIVSSYSGNTEEALSCLEDAQAKKANIAIITSGGKLLEIAQQKNITHIQMPKLGQPRYAVFHSLRAMVTLLEKADLIDEQDAEKNLHEAADFLKESIKSWTPDVPTKDNFAKQLAKEMVGKTPVMYAGKVLTPAAYKWKIDFNENAKNVAWFGTYPEFNHNEFIGWSSHPTDKPYEIVDLRSSFEHPRVIKRFKLSDKLLSGRRPKAHVIDAQGDTKLEHILWTIVLGDFVTLYTALLNGVNPTPVDLVERLKKELQ